VPDVRGIAAAYKVAIELTDLGAWGTTTLVAEYDPSGPVIRVNERAIPSGSSCAAREHIDRAIAHELYHHREAIGEIPRLRSRIERERAADAFADAVLHTR
jgi:hypothetical protein